MLVLNPTDENLQGTFSINDPIQRGGQELIRPATSFDLAPRAVTEIPDAAGAHLIDKFGDKGVVRFRMGEDEAHAIKIGRRVYYRFICAQIAVFQQENQRRLAQGIAPAQAGKHILDAARIKDGLDREFTAEGDAIMQIKLPEDTGATATLLSPEQQLAQFANRNSARNQEMIDTRAAASAAVGAP